MIKKIFAYILSLMLLTLTIGGINAANSTFEVENNKGTLEVSTDTILVGNTEKNTSIIDLFKNINIDGKTVNDNVINILDVRYITPDKVDNKINSDTDIIDKNSKVFVLFKNKTDGGLVDKNSTFKFELKNLKLKEIGNVSNLKDNSYTKIYDVVYITKTEKEESPIIKKEEKVIEKVIDQNVLKDNNTGIKDNILYIIISMLILIGLIAYPKYKNI